MSKDNSGNTTTVDKDEVAKEAKKVKKTLSGQKPIADTPQFGDPVNAEVLISSLAHSSILIRARCRVWSGTASDKDWAAILASSAQGMKDSFSVMVKILPPSMKSELARRVNRFNNILAVNSIPWTDGWRLLSTSIYVDVKKALEAAATEVRDYVEELARRRSEIVEHAKLHLGKAYHEDRVPSVEDIKRSLTVIVEKSDVHIPQKLNGIDTKEMDELREEMMAEVKRRYNEGIMELIDSLRETMERLVDELDKNPDNDRVSYKRTLDMCDSRINNILRLDVFKSKRVYAALEHINDNVLNPIREHLAQIKGADKDKKEGAKAGLKAAKAKVKAAAGMLDGLAV